MSGGISPEIVAAISPDPLALGRELSGLVPKWKVEVYLLPFQKWEDAHGEINDRRQKITLRLWINATKEDALSILAHEYAHLQPGTSLIERGVDEVTVWRRGERMAKQWGVLAHYRRLAQELAD